MHHPVHTSGALQDAPDSSSPNWSGHLPALDGLRGLAILLVLFNNLYDGPASGGIDYVVFHACKSGWIGVDLFFVLSGFLITGLLWDAKGGAHYFRNFYARRFLRIFPAYYGVLAVWLLLTPHISTLSAEAVQGLRSRQMWYWLYLANSIPPHAGSSAAEPGTFWSLAVEEQFYLVWPLIVATSTRQRLVRICIGMIVVAFAIRLLGRVLSPSQLTENLLYTLTPARMDDLAMGALAAVTVRSREGLSRALAWARPVALAGGIILLVWLVTGRGLRPDAFLAQTAGYSILGATAAAILVLATTAAVGSRLRVVLTHPALRFFGRYSYGIYLIHGPLYLMWRTEPWYVRPRVLWGSQLPGAFAALLTVVVVATGLAMLSWHLYEKQFLKLKSHFPYDRRGAGQPAAAGSGAPSISKERGSPE